MRRAVSHAFALLLALEVSCTGSIDNGLVEGNTPGPVGDVNGAGGNGKVSVDTTGSLYSITSSARRLSVREYNAVVAALIYDTSSPLVFGQDRRPFETSPLYLAAEKTIDDPSTTLIDTMEAVAGDAARRLQSDKARLAKVMSAVGCAPKSAGDRDCFKTFLARFGRRALRRPLTAENLNTYMALFKFAEDANDFYAAVGAAVRVFLQHPELLYRIESDTSLAVPGKSGVYQLSGWEMASRLSFLLWGEAPDDALLDQAGSGALDTADGVRKEALAMLADRRARATVASLHAMWFSYDNLQGVSPALISAMKRQTDTLVQKVIFDDQRPWQDLLRSSNTFVNYNLATHYKIPIPAASALKAGSASFEWLDWGSARQGLLSEGAFLAIAGNADEEQLVIRRGKYIRERLFCESLPPKPADVKSPDTLPASPCKWDVMAAHRASQCASCHNAMDPVGFGLDGYDNEGAPRTYDKVDVFIKNKFPNLKVGDVLTQCRVHSQGTITLEDGDHTFSGPGRLADLMAKSSLLNGCVAQQVYRFAVGHPTLDETEKQFAAEVSARIGTGDFKFHDLMQGLVSSDTFRCRQQSN